DDGTVRLWKVSKGANPWRALAGPIRAHGPFVDVRFSPDDRFLATCGRNTVALWDTSTGSPYRAPLPPGGRLRAIVFSPRSAGMLATCSDDAVRLWDVLTSEARGEALRPGGYLPVPTFSPDGNLLATASSDRTVRIWRVSPVPTPARKLVHH